MKINKIILLFILFIPALCSAGQVRHISVVYCVDIAPFEYTSKQGIPYGLIIDFWKLWEKKQG
jgi:hypothetical protein